MTKVALSTHLSKTRALIKNTTLFKGRQPPTLESMLFVAENFNEGLKDNIDWGEGYYTGGRDRYYVYYAKKVPF